MADDRDPNALEVTLPLVQKAGDAISPPFLVSFRETRAERHSPHMYQARIVIAGIDGVPQDPKSPPGTDTVLEGDCVAAFTGKTGDKLWFLFGKNRDLKFKPEAAGHRYSFTVQLWACWYDRSAKTWQRQFYQGEVQTNDVLCGPTTEWPGGEDARWWDCDQVESIRELSEKEPPATLLELTSKFPKLTPHPDLFTGPWASPNRPK